MSYKETFQGILPYIAAFCFVLIIGSERIGNVSKMLMSMVMGGTFIIVKSVPANIALASSNPAPMLLLIMITCLLLYFEKHYKDYFVQYESKKV